ncbi:MAG: 3-phosphoshikimate 1-carboxyvinyltransferase [Planctomycetota bacterium]|nr:3-phosphoshikimate 1-carboxyvinyltransferase [Planctomycetota bacterium]
MIDYTLPLEELPDPLPIEPLEKPFDVTITPPGSKSITNRAYVLAALADGESRIIRPLRSDDCDNLLEALCTLGAEARWEGNDVLIKGVNGRFPRGGSVNLGDGGAPTRFMIACACLAVEPVIVDGSPRMRQRPIAEGIDMLRQLGAHIEYVEEEGRLPVRVVPSDDFKGGELTVGKTASSQFVSAVVLVAACLERGVTIRYREEITSATYLWLTEGIAHHWGIRAFGECDEGTWRRTVTWVEPGRIASQKYVVEPDASSCTYWLTAAATIINARVKLRGWRLDSSQPDVRLAGVLEDMGARVHWTDGAGDVDLSSHQRLSARDQDLRDMPDAAMSLAVACATAEGACKITGLHTLRVKETDRIAALANELRKIGCTVETTEDSITIDPSTRHEEPIVIETYNDHRMAMAFGVLGLARPGISIRDPKCVKKSYPGFWADFAKLYQ